MISEPTPEAPLILVAEDEAIVAADIRARLIRMGYKAHDDCMTGQKALQLTESLKPNLVLMDVRLRGEMDGITAAQAIREQFRIPVVFLTAYSEDATLQRAKVAEPYGYVLKPFEDRELKSILEIALYKHKSEHEIYRLNRLYDVLSQINQAIVRTDCDRELLEITCRLLVERGGLDLAWIALVDAKSNEFLPAASHARRQEHLAAVTVGTKLNMEKCSLLCNNLKEGRAFLCNRQGTESCMLHGHADLSRLGFQSCGVFWLRYKGSVMGVINLCVSEKDFFGGREMELFDGVAEDISFALHKHELNRLQLEYERQLKESKNRFDQLAEQARTVAWEVDCNGLYTYISHVSPVVFGYTREELVGKKYFYELHPVAGRKQFKANVLRGFREKAAIKDLENPVQTKDGNIIWVSTNGIPLLDEGGNLLGYRGADQDITDRKRSEQIQRQLATAIEQAAESVVITDSRGNILYVNPTFEQVSGYSKEEVLGKNPSILKSGKHDASFYKSMWKTVLAGNVWSGNFINRAKDGSFFQEATTISPIRDSKDSISGFVALKHDITRQVQLEEQVRQTQKMESIGQLAGGVAHDFNNILSAIMMHLDLLSMSAELDDEGLSVMQELKDEAKRAASLTRQLLMFSRRSVMESAELNLNQVIRNLLKMLDRLIREDIRLIFKPGEDLPMVFADAGMMEQVLMNLVVNARDALPRGGQITISTDHARIEESDVSLHPNRKSGLFVRLVVSDNGVGMDQHTVLRIFEPFFTTKELGKGTGLGLSTVFGIVGQHGGWIEVQSALGHGSVFSVYLPVTAKTKAQQNLPAIDLPANISGRETILLVEDATAVRTLISILLRKCGYQVLEADNGQNAILEWQKAMGTVDLLFADLVMPEGMTGFELASKLREEKPTLKVIISSGYKIEEITKGEKKSPENIVYLSKPYQIQELAGTVRRCLDAVWSAQTASKSPQVPCAQE